MWVRLFGRRHLWGACVGIQFGCHPVDSATLVGMATAFGIFPAEVALSKFWIDVIFKELIAVVSIPMIYWVKLVRLALFVIRSLTSPLAGRTARNDPIYTEEFSWKAEHGGGLAVAPSS